MCRLLDRNTRKYSEGVQQETGTGIYEVKVQITIDRTPENTVKKWFKKLEQESMRLNDKLLDRKSRKDSVRGYYLTGKKDK